MKVLFSLADKNRRIIIPFAITFATITLVYFLPQDEFRTSLVFGVLLLAFSIYKFDSRILIFYAIVLLLITAILTAKGVHDLTEPIAVVSYWLLAIGIVGIIIDLFRNSLLKEKTTVSS